LFVNTDTDTQQSVLTWIFIQQSILRLCNNGH